jgi:hypothetical protein
MKLRRRAHWLAVSFVVGSLVVPGVGMASGPWRWVDPPQMGDPDTPGAPRGRESARGHKASPERASLRIAILVLPGNYVIVAPRFLPPLSRRQSR